MVYELHGHPSSPLLVGEHIIYMYLFLVPLYNNNNNNNIERQSTCLC